MAVEGHACQDMIVIPLNVVGIPEARIQGLYVRGSRQHTGLCRIFASMAGTLRLGGVGEGDKGASGIESLVQS